MKTRLSKVYENMPKKKRVTKLTLITDIDNFFSGAPDPAADKSEINSVLAQGEKLLTALEDAQRELNNYSQVIYGESWMPEGHYMSYRSEAQSLAEDLQQKLEDIGLAGDNNFPEINELEVYAEDLEDLKLLNAEQGRQWDLIITEINSINDSSIT
jgi:hypothetical protein